MQNIRSKNTEPERLLMAELKKRRIYFARHCMDIYGKPDVVFRRKKVAVFIDSDFWHGHPVRGTMPRTNRAFWVHKIAVNQARDRKVTRRLRREGWSVIRIWEYDVRHRLDVSVRRVLRSLSRRPS